MKRIWICCILSLLIVKNAWSEDVIWNGFSEHIVLLEYLDEERGQGGVDLSVLNESNVQATLTDNMAINNTTGNNIIDTSSFSNSAGIISVIQNTGNNVIIQNSTVVNFVITP